MYVTRKMKNPRDRKDQMQRYRQRVQADKEEGETNITEKIVEKMKRLKRWSKGKEPFIVLHMPDSHMSHACQKM